jgi:hypothetical protein
MAVGLLLGALGLATFVRRLKLLRTGAKAFGLVAEMGSFSSREGLMYAPTVTFTTRMGETIYFTSKLGANPPRFQVGQEVAVV